MMVVDAANRWLAAGGKNIKPRNAGLFFSYKELFSNFHPR